MAENFKLGRKVFFLYPPSVIQEEVIQVIIGEEYEVHILQDHRRALKLLPRHDDAILFVNIDSEQLTEDGWGDYIKSVINGPDTRGVGVGILTYNENRELAEKYLMDIGVPCGYIKLSLGVKESTAVLLKTLEANEARGRRKYVRVRCDERSNGTFNINLEESRRTGVIKDISSAGMACTFDDPVDLELRAVVPDIQLRLKSALCHVSGIVAGIRREGNTEYVIIFGGKMAGDTLTKIRNFIFNTLQDTIERELLSL